MIRITAHRHSFRQSYVTPCKSQVKNTCRLLSLVAHNLVEIANLEHDDSVGIVLLHLQIFCIHRQYRRRIFFFFGLLVIFNYRLVRNIIFVYIVDNRNFVALVQYCIVYIPFKTFRLFSNFDEQICVLFQSVWQRLQRNAALFRKTR